MPASYRSDVKSVIFHLRLGNASFTEPQIRQAVPAPSRLGVESVFRYVSSLYIKKRKPTDFRVHRPPLPVYFSISRTAL
nr:MAG TPA: hypothetical protein [Caudoviricetes sp.]